MAGLSGTKQSCHLDYGCSAWRKSSQLAHNLFEDGTKLWTKKDLRDIEQQLAESARLENFTVRSIDGETLSIANPMFNQRHPIWKPRVKFQEYWRLVKMQPDGPPETYRCSYLVDWINISAQRFWGVTEDSRSAFEENRRAWNASRSCELLKSQLEGAAVSKRVTKIVCFGLGDMCRKLPERVRRKGDPDNLETSYERAAMVQHSMALTIAEVFRHKTGTEVRLLAQDPDYTDEAKEILEGHGFSAVGQFGAGGFAEVDNTTAVFSIFVEAPLKQIIADIARPLLIVVSTGLDAFNDTGNPWVDAESPRTLEMWKEYERTNFPVSPEDEKLTMPLRDVYIYIKKEVDIIP